MKKLLKELKDEIREIKKCDWDAYKNIIKGDLGLTKKEYFENGAEMDNFDDYDGLRWSIGYCAGIKYAIDKIKREETK